MPWVETASPSFQARHELLDAKDIVEVLELLEGTRERLREAFERVPEEVTVVVHGSGTALALAQPYLPLLRRLTAPAARRYLVGWFATGQIHVLAPRLLRARASSVPGSVEMALLAPAALYTHLVVGASNPQLPPPFRAGTIVRHLRWAWLAHGAAQYFSGQTAYARPAIARRLREGSSPAFPPGVRDAALLGGTVVDLVARTEGESAAVALASSLPRGGPREAVRRALRGGSLAEAEREWRAHLAHLAEP